jgi:protease I
MKIPGRNAAILVADMYNDLEFWYPYYRLKEAGIGVTVVGVQAGALYTGKAGIPVHADVAADQFSAGDCDVLIIPGGYAPDIMRRHPSMVKLVRDCALAGKTVAAICHAGWMLASAEVVKGRTVTSFFAIKDDLLHAGATWVDKEVVVDGNLVTSRTPDDLPAFMRAVLASLA